MDIKRLSAVLLVAMMLISCTAMDENGERKVRNYWNIEDNTLTFESDFISARAEAPRGWTSLKVDGAEFLHAGDEYGGILFRKGEKWITDYPQVSNLSHDSKLGRLGSVQDGVFKADILTLWSLPKFEMYAGFNREEDHDLVIVLSDAVVAVRPRDPDRKVIGVRGNVTPPGPDSAQKLKDGAMVVHRSGKALGVYDPVYVEKVTVPDGSERLALVLPCQGHAANSFDFIARTDSAIDRRVVHPKLNVEVKNGDEALYTPDSEITLTMDFGWLGDGGFDGHMEVEFLHGLGQVDYLGREQITEAHRRGGRYSVSIRPEPTMPGVSDIWTRLVSADGNVVDVKRFRGMYDWESFEPEYNTPADMKKFWEQTLSELREIPLEPEMQRVYEDHPEWKIYHVSYNGWDGQRIHACMYIHKDAETPLPVNIGSHPSRSGFGLDKNEEGVYGSDIGKDKRFLTLVPLIRGHEPDAEDIPFNRPWWGDLDDRDNYVARSWYCAMVRGLDFLATHPELADMDRVIAAGGSQGGALALVTAALDDRVDACLAHCPSNSMMHYSIEAGKYNSFGPGPGQVPEGKTLQDVKDLLAYYDPAHMAPWIKAETVIGVITGDLTVHSMGGLGVYKNLTGLEDDRKWFLPSRHISHRHGNSPRGRKRMQEIRDEIANE